MQRPTFDDYDIEQFRRIIVAILGKTRNGRVTTVQEVSQTARTTSSAVSSLLSESLPTVDLSRISLDRKNRLNLISQGMRLGAPDSIAKVLSWQEFEEFIQNCLDSNGFSAMRGVIVSDEKRRWQIDVVAVKDEMLLSVDCKHWQSSNSIGRFTAAIDHQRESLHALIRHMRRNGILHHNEIRALPIIITIFEPRERLVNKVLFVSVAQLGDFLEHLSPYDNDLPFTNDLGEKPYQVRQNPDDRDQT